MRRYFLRELMYRGEFGLISVKPEVQHADFSTKAPLQGDVLFPPGFFFGSFGPVVHFCGTGVAIS